MKKTCCDYSQLITLTRIRCAINPLLVLMKEFHVEIEIQIASISCTIVNSNHLVSVHYWGCLLF